MLPFLKPKLQTGVIVKTREADHKDEPQADDIEYCAKDLLKAIEAKDAKGIAEALKSAFTILDSMPPDEGPHTNNYESQNKLAAEEQ